MIEEIYSRRSIRKYSDTPINKETIEKIISAGTKAPSAKNRQPWKFIVTSGMPKIQMLQAMRNGILKEEKGQGILKNSQRHLAAAKHTIDIMEQAPVIIFILNPLGHSLYEEISVEQKIYDRANIESIGACIQNMLLEAQSIGLGTLWICDVYFAYGDLNEWLNSNGEMLAAVALGHPDQQPKSRPRKPISGLIEWRET